MVSRTFVALILVLAVRHVLGGDVAKPSGNAAKLGLANRISSEQLASLVSEQLIPAHRAGKHLLVHKVLAPIVSKADQQVLSELDELLSDEFQPSLSEILAELHLQPAGKRKPNPGSVNESVLVLEHAKASIEEILDQRSWVVMLDPNRQPESSFDEFERAIWDAHVYRNQLENAIKRVKLAARFQRQHFKAIKAKRPTFATTNYNALAKKLYRARVELHERDLDLKLRRVDFAIKSLEEQNQLAEAASDSVDAALSRIWSVYVLQKDGETLLEALKAYEKPRNQFEFLEDLNKAKARSAARKKIKAGRKLVSRDLLERSENLFDGLHWWFRGRYGRGTHQLGLLKPPAAAHNIKAQNALKMPKQPPRPTDPAMFARMVQRKKQPVEPKREQHNATKQSPIATEQSRIASDNSELEVSLSGMPSAGDDMREQDDYVYGVDYDKRYARSPDYDRRHHYIWSQKPPMFVTQPVKMYFH